MSTVIGLVKEDRQLINLINKLELVGSGLDQIKVLTRPEEAQSLLYQKNFANSHLLDWVVTGTLLGVGIFLPLSFLVTLASCTFIGGCTVLAWGPGIVFLAMMGAVTGGIIGSFVGTRRLELSEQVYVEGLGEGDKLVVIPAASAETAARTAKVMERERAIAIQILDNQT